MEYSPPPLFKHGPSALARLLFFVALALALLVADVRFKALNTVREVIGTALYPLQRIALMPRDLFTGTTDMLVSSASLRSDNRTLAARNLALALQASQAAELGAENTHLRALLQLTQRSTIQAVPAEIQYDTRDPFTQRVIIDKGLQAGLQAGAPVVSEQGVVGQLTRIYPLQSEVTLISDKDQAVPVQILRTGVRSIIYGTARGDTLDLRFVPSGADVRAGDELVTSGLDGVYPPGLPVATVVRIDRQADTAFARVVCVPVAPITAARQLLVLAYRSPAPPRPDETPPVPTGKGRGTPQKASAAAPATASGSAPSGTAATKATTKAAPKPSGKNAPKGAGKEPAKAAVRPKEAPKAAAGAGSTGNTRRAAELQRLSAPR